MFFFKRKLEVFASAPRNHSSFILIKNASVVFIILPSKALSKSHSLILGDISVRMNFVEMEIVHTTFNPSPIKIIFWPSLREGSGPRIGEGLL